MLVWVMLLLQSDAELTDSANQKIQRRDYDGAIADCTKIIDRNPKNRMAYYFRGSARHSKKDLDGAIADFTRCIELDPEDFSGYKGRAEARRDKKEYAGSVEDWNKVIEIMPMESYVILRADVKTLMGDYDGAIADMTRAIRSSPKAPGNYLVRANFHVLRRDFESAYADYDKAIEIDPKYASAFARRGLARYSQGLFKTAAADFRKVLELQPSWELYRLTIWLARSRQGEIEEATAELKEKGEFKVAAYADVAAFLLSAISHDELLKKAGENIADAYLFIGTVRLIQGDKVAAREMFLKCVEVGKKENSRVVIAAEELRRLEK